MSARERELQAVMSALKAACLKEFGSTWGNEVTRRFAEAAINAVQPNQEGHYWARLLDDGLAVQSGKPGRWQVVWLYRVHGFGEWNVAAPVGGHCLPEEYEWGPRVDQPKELS